MNDYRSLTFDQQCAQLALVDRRLSALGRASRFLGGLIDQILNSDPDIVPPDWLWHMQLAISNRRAELIEYSHGLIRAQLHDMRIL